MNCKRLLAAGLTAASLSCLLALPARAAYFPDIPDRSVSQAADLLYELGVVNGDMAGDFRPDDPLSRVQFCKMAIEVMGQGDKAAAQMNRTIFADVTGSHWGRGYVNLAATLVLDEDTGARLMLGTGNGLFAPDRDISFQEAVTLLLRMLGYSAEANRSWPAGAIQTAAELGLSQGVEVADPAGPVSRGQTALLFSNLLFLKAKGEDTRYIERMGTVVEDVTILSANITMGGETGWIVTDKGGPYRAAGEANTALAGQKGDLLLDKQGRFLALLTGSAQAQETTSQVEDAIILAVNATINGQSGWLVTTQGNFRAANGADAGLVGKRGSLLLDRDGLFLTLLADNSQSVSVTVSRAQSGYLYATDGSRYTVASDTPVYLGSTGEASTYAEQLPGILGGEVVTVYLDAGKVVGLFRAATTAQSSFMVAGRSVGAADLSALTGGASNYAIRKNGSAISLRDIGEYDVLTYDPISRVVYVCDTRIDCVYENAYPSLRAPSRVTTLGGNTFDVMADAMDDLGGFDLGDSFTLLFTSDGRVAGAVRRGGGNAMGVVDGGSLTLLGLNRTVDLANCADAADLDGQLVSVSGSRGEVELRRLSLSGRTGDLEPSALRLGDLTVSAGVKIYEKGASGLAAVSLSSLRETVPSSRISGYHTDGAGYVDVIVLRNYTGDSGAYGLIESTSRIVKTAVKGTPVTIGGSYVWVATDGGAIGEVRNSVGNVLFPRVFNMDEMAEGGEKPDSSAYDYVIQSDTLHDRTMSHRVDARGDLLDSENYLLDRRGERVTEEQEIEQLKFSTPDGSKVYDARGRVRDGFGTIRTGVETDRETGEERTYASVDDQLSAIKDVRSADFYTADGITWVQAGGKTYQVADDVLCWNGAASTGTWEEDDTTGTSEYVTHVLWFSSLLEARTFSDTLTIYVDSVGGKVRAVST